MGASHAAFFSTDEQVHVPNYSVEQRLYPGSGRMMRTFRIRHDETGALVVTKYMHVTKEDEDTVQKHLRELRRIKDALQDEPHVAPFVAWKLGDYQTRSPGTLPIRFVQLLRPHVYTTLSDRLATRPFLDHVEKLWIFYQLLAALQSMHEKGVVHGFLTTENIGLSSWNFVVILDLASYKPQTSLPDDDPSEYLYYFQELNKHGSDTTPREKRCYLAPERFSSLETAESKPMTRAMDIFSAGCVGIETFLNGERALDLGDLMEYRSKGSFTTSLQQKLNKIESSSLRAACRHMLHLDPAQRLSASSYLERLSSVIPAFFKTDLDPFFRLITCEALHPDAQLAMTASFYARMLQHTVGSTDEEGSRYFVRLLGPTFCATEGLGGNELSVSELATDAKKERHMTQDCLLSETEALLHKLDSLKFDDDDDDDDEESLQGIQQSGPDNTPSVPLSTATTGSLLIILQVVLSTVRNVQRPSSKYVGLQLLDHCGRFSCDESKLQRIVPVAISLLQDQEALVRATAVQVITSTMSTIKVFPPSDSKIFQQYIFKRMAHLISDQSLVVRVTFASCIALLADTANRFLDVSHAVRLHEAVGAASAEVGSSHGFDAPPEPHVFTDDVARLLGGSSTDETTETNEVKPSSDDHQKVPPFGATLIDDSYTTEHAALQEIVSRWVVQITTDQSEHSSPTKRSLLCDLTRLCNFFGREGVMAFILPQILAFLNDRRDWQLRAALFRRLPSVCYILGRAATEHFVLPCLETALVDSEHEVVESALHCMTLLVEMGLTSRSILIAPPKLSAGPGEQNRDLLERYLPLLLSPESNVRRSAIELVTSCFRSFGFPDTEVFLLPMLRPFLRFEPGLNGLVTSAGLEKCLVQALSRENLEQRMAAISAPRDFPELEKWTPIAAGMKEGSPARLVTADKSPSASDRTGKAFDVQQTGLTGSLEDRVSRYAALLLRGNSSISSLASEPTRYQFGTAIEGSIKLAQSIKFPKQGVSGSSKLCLPSWYSRLAQFKSAKNLASPPYALRSPSALGQVYGLSILHSAAANIEKDPFMKSQREDAEFVGQGFSNDDIKELLGSIEAKKIQATCQGEWGSGTMIDPSVDDTALLIAKLQGLDVPVLPPDLSTLGSCGSQVIPKEQSETTQWTSKVDGIVASSSQLHGHTASASRIALSPDQRFFVSASHDGTCRVWELRQLENADGVLESSAIYSGHLNDNISPSSTTRVNDVESIENSHSVASGGSDGSVHVWRVDMVSGTKSPQSELDTIGRDASSGGGRGRSVTVSGSSVIRKIDSSEGEVLAVSHFNSPSASLVLFATQSCVHSWDLRSPREPFKLEIEPDLGYQTCLAIGADRNWIVTGTSRGFLPLWDVRFQQMAKLWRHSGGRSVRSLSTYVTSPSRVWGTKGLENEEDRPFILTACGRNEFSLFDLASGSCRQTFQVSSLLEQGYGSRPPLSFPVLETVSVSLGSKMVSSQFPVSHVRMKSQLDGPCLNALAGSLGSGRSYVISGGDDGYVRYWDFNTPGKCYTVSGSGLRQRPFYERLDRGGRRLMYCQQSPPVSRGSSGGPKRSQMLHSHDSIQDLKVLNDPMNGFVSCSRDGLVRVWR